MKRSGPIARRTQMKRTQMKRKRRRARPGLDDRRYLAFVRTLPCCVCNRKPPNHAHHLTGQGLAMKANDDETMSLCRDDHRDLHEFAGYFRGWSRERRAAWQHEQIAATRAAFASRAA